MFGIGFSELMVILVIAFVLIDPKQMPKYGKIVGLTIQSLKQGIHELKSEVEKEIIEPLEKSDNAMIQTVNTEIKQTQRILKDVQAEIRKSLKN